MLEENIPHPTSSTQQYYVQQRSFQRLGSETRTASNDGFTAYRGDAIGWSLHRKHQFYGGRNWRDAGIFSVGKLCYYHWDGSVYACGFKNENAVQSP